MGTSRGSVSDMHLIFEGKPIAKKRHQMKRKVAYNPQHTQKMQAKWYAASQMREKGFKMLPDGPIEVKVSVYTAIPKSFSKTRKNALEGEPTTTTPDLDNYLKWIFDVLNGIAYSDDRFITKISCEKKYSSKPRVEIWLELI